MNITRGAIPLEPEVSLTIPCYNEEECLESTIPPLIEAFHQQQISLEIILVDNGSTDNTGRIIDRFLEKAYPVVKARLEIKQGYSKGITAGLSLCRAPVIGFMHADGQISPADVVRTYHVIAGRAERVLVKIRRRFRADNWRRKLISITYNLMMQGLFGGLGSIDINASPKMFSRRHYEAMQCRSRDGFLDTEIILKAKKMGLLVIEIDAESRFRQGGGSHVKLATIAEFLRNIWIYRTSPYLKQWRSSLDDRSQNPEEPTQETANIARPAGSADLFDQVRIQETKRIEDDRGYLHKILTASQHGEPVPWHGEVYVSAAHPNKAKGNHLHRRMGEWFALIQGQGSVELLDPATGKRRSISLDAQRPKSVYVPAGLAHVVVNRGDQLMIVVAWAEQEYDPADVYPIAVWPREEPQQGNKPANPSNTDHKPSTETDTSNQ